MIQFARRAAAAFPIMNRLAGVALLGLLLVAAPACHRNRAEVAPPDARKPQLKTEAELAADREQRIQRGEIIATNDPVYLEAERQRFVAELAQPVAGPKAGDITSDAVVIDEETITIAEVLYAIRDRIEEGRRTQTPAGFREQLARWVRRELQEQVGRLLLYKKAVAPINDPGKEMIKRQVDRQFDEALAKDFDGSKVKLENHLRRYGLTLDQFRASIERRVVVQQYLFENIRPQIQIRRDELLDEYRRQIVRFSSGALREILIIEAPFEKFLPEHVTWDQANSQQQAQARLRAARQIREADEALATEPFEDVARRLSRGLHAEDGGSWGELGKPLQGPYETISTAAFQLSAGERSEPIETPTGWYIVKCGKVTEARTIPFEEAQSALRQEMMDNRFNRTATDYVLKLAEKATMSSMEAFIKEATRRGALDGWPDVPLTAR